ncbi:MAG: VOC family protein [Terriglobia bacterium]
MTDGVDVMGEQAQQIIGSAPYFFVSDVVKAAEYYRDVLGFADPRVWGDPPEFCMPRRDGFIVMLSQVRDPSRISPNGKINGHPETWDAYFWINDAEALFQEFKNRGASVVYEPCILELYEMKEFAVRDLDGYVLAFGQDWPKSSRTSD